MDPEPSSSLTYLILSLVFLFFACILTAIKYAILSFPLFNSDLSKEDKDDSLDFVKNSKINFSVSWVLDNSRTCLSSLNLGFIFTLVSFSYFGVSYLNSKFSFFTLSSVSNYETYSYFFNFSLNLLLSFLLISLSIIVSELFTKSFTVENSVAILNFLSYPLKIYSKLFTPLLLIQNGILLLILKPFNLNLEKAEVDHFNQIEIRKLLSSVNSNTEIGSDQARMIRGIVGFSETVAREVMTPRTDLVTIKIDSTLDTVIKTILDTGFSRYPVRGERIDDVLGVLLARDVLPLVVKDSPNNSAQKNFELKKIMRQAYYIPGTKPIDELLSEFKKRKQHMAIILDEHGGVDGVVTLEDIIEEIVGDIYDESDETENDFFQDENGDLLIDGGVLVADINERYQLFIPEGQYDTIAGFIFTCLGQIPKVNDSIFISKSKDIFINGLPENLSNQTSNKITTSEFEENLPDEGLSIEVEKVEGHRIELVRIKFHSKKIEEPAASSESDLQDHSSELKIASLS